MQFHNFSLKSVSWLKVGNYNIFDVNKNIAYKVESNIWSFKKVFFLKSKDGREIFKIAANSSFNTSYSLFEDDELIAQIEKPFSWSTPTIEISTTISDPFVVKGNIWGNDYRFFRDDEEFAIVSYNIWSTGHLGVSIKDGENMPLVLSVVIIIAYLKQSGMA